MSPSFVGWSWASWPSSLSVGDGTPALPIRCRVQTSPLLWRNVIGPATATNRQEHGGQWPCVEVTHVDLESQVLETIPAKDQSGNKAGNGYCFYVTFNVETTPWDRTQGEPAEPRTYADAPERPLSSAASLAALEAMLLVPPRGRLI